MPKVVVSIDGVVIKELQLTKDRTTVGRRPYNDIVIDNLAVSGEHAAFKLAGDRVRVEDLGSTNGTFVNGQSTRFAVLQDGDVLEVGRYQLRVVDERGFTRTTNPAALGRRSATAPLASSPGPTGPGGLPSGLSAPGLLAGAQLPSGASGARIQVLNGAAAGREMLLTKVVSTLGKPGVGVASITRVRGGYELAHVEGEVRGTLNGTLLGDKPVLLHDGDVLSLAGIQMRFEAQ